MRIARSTGAFSGFLVALLGIWGGLIPFVGPYFNYSFGTDATWHYTSNRLWLSILPGAVALLGGLLMMAASRRHAGILGSWIAMAAGAWFAIGPAVSRVWEHAEGPIGRPMYGNVRQMLELVGYFYGLGALIVGLAAFAAGRFFSRPQLETPAEAAAAGEEPRAAEEGRIGRGPARRPRTRAGSNVRVRSTPVAERQSPALGREAPTAAPGAPVPDPEAPVAAADAPVAARAEGPLAEEGSSTSTAGGERRVAATGGEGRRRRGFMSRHFTRR